MAIWESIPKSANCLEVEANSALAVQAKPSRDFPVVLDEHSQVSRIELGETIELFGKHMIFHSPEECGTGALLESGFLLCANNGSASRLRHLRDGIAERGVVVLYRRADTP